MLGAQPYLNWHRTLGSDLVMSDIDSVELSTMYHPLAFIELKPLHNVIGDADAYLRSLIQDYIKPGKVGHLFRFLMKNLPESEFLIVAPDFRSDCKRFYVFNLKRDSGWVVYSEQEYVHRLRLLRR